MIVEAGGRWIEELVMEELKRVKNYDNLIYFSFYFYTVFLDRIDF
jgi:hypothetical protein